MPPARLFPPALLCLLTACLIPAHAQDAGTPEDSAAAQVIDVRGTRDPDLQPYRTMLKGLDAYADHQRLAPGAPLRFKLMAATPAVSMADVALRLEADNLSVAIPLASDGTFALTRDKTAYDANADLVSNKKRSTVRWRPNIVTPGLPANVRRLGDLRLECEVRWAVEQDALPFMRRNLFKLAGGPCHSAMISVPYPAARTLAGVLLKSGDRSVRLPLGEDRQRYTPPLHDASWNDDALLTFSYADEEQAATAARKSL
ncbi:hypothetical protein [Janthinobacterium psychrotolerans]|uniref:Uncharacterized protein n=1 Tax=Janthinobacterium psychrotolerans TaxID=1747903 RepID=A0A1A7C0E5_9BURK|nr:hypothetical protein [Janthinobacterium psychrotolerans]OBV39212.1 hypothetical protein ASR47_100926 [Janthinobacterium psychrotolerans]